MIGRARALLTGLIATATLIAVVIGLPVVLYKFGGSPLPRQLAGWHRVAEMLTSGDSGTLLLAIVRDCSWLAWLLFTIAVLTEVQAAARGRAAPRLWLGGMQGGAARLVALAGLMFAAPSAVTLTASVATVAPAHAGQDHDRSQAALPDPARSSPGATLDSASASRLITVRKGDCLWTIARHYLGAGDRYPEIVSMNYGHDMGDGQVFTNPSLIEPGWRMLVPATDVHDDPSLAGDGPARHLGHPTHDAHFRRQHPTAGLRPAVGKHSAEAQHASAAAVPADNASGSDAAGYQTSANVAAASEHIPEAAAFGAGALAGAILMSLGRLRRRQRQYRRRGRRIALPDDPAVLAAEQRLRAAAPDAPPATLLDALSYLESGITSAGQALPDIVGLHVTPRVLEILLASPALESPPAPYSISPGRQGMCWQLPLSADSGPGPAGPAGPGAPSERGSGLLPGLFTAGGTDDGYLLLDLESLQVTGCDGPRELIDQVVTAAATELATGQWSGWYDLVLVGFDELEVLGRAEHCANLDAALGLLDARCRATSRRLVDQPPADVRQLRLEAPEDEDWGLTILVSRIEPAPDQMTHLLELAEDGPGGIAALVAGDPETADGRMAPTVLQLAPDPRRAGEILANVIPLQIMVRPQVLSGADYEAIGTLFGAATDLQDVSPQRAPYEVYGAPPWIPQAAQLRPQDETEGSDWSVGVLMEEAGCAADELAIDADADAGADAERPTWHHVSNFAEPQWHPAAAPRHSAGAPDAGTNQTPADGIAAPPWAALAGEQDGAAQPPPRLDVRILGSFTITGAVDQLQPKQAELVLALALAAPAGLTNSALCSMLGTDPDHPKPSDAVRQIITRTRRRLGHARDGQEYIIHAGNGSYVLHPDASLDWTEFRKLTSTARVEDMRAAMALVRGQPFTGSYYWWLDIPLLETVRAEIVDAAETLAEFELATGSARAAARAARAGLTAEASSEQLWRLLMRAEHAGGNLLGVAEAWRRCLDAIEDIAPGGEPHPDTEALYRQLTAGTRQQAASRG